MTDNSEPAFPYQERDVDGFFEQKHGMTLRDYFAAKAMQGMLTGAPGYILDGKEPSAYAHGSCNAAIVERAYVIADAMLQERDR
jgi:hypothetical protein